MVQKTLEFQRRLKLYNPYDMGIFQRETFQDCACMTVSLSEMKKANHKSHTNKQCRKRIVPSLHAMEKVHRMTREHCVDCGPHFTISTKNFNFRLESLLCNYNYFEEKKKL